LTCCNQLLRGIEAIPGIKSGPQRAAVRLPESQQGSTKSVGEFS
jgi:hypothetical protein